MTTTHDNEYFFVTKYALTKGIFRVKNNDRVTVCHDHYLYYRFFHGQSISVSQKDWFLTEAEARARVEVMRKARIKSLKRQIDRVSLVNIGTIELSGGSR
jgi:hypothetical protein